MRRTALAVIILIISALAFPAVYQPLSGQIAVAHATPALSGAIRTEIPNGNFSGVGLGAVGTPPTNSTFQSASTPAGTPATNYNFETGDLTGWTVTGSPAVHSGGPTGYYAQLGGGQGLRSSAFTVDSNAQTLNFDIAAVNGGAFYWYINIYSGTGYATESSHFLSSCPTSCTNWNTYTFDAVVYQGQSIKVEVKQYWGDLKADNLGAMMTVVPGWSPNDGSRISRQTGGPNGAFADISTPVTSQAFTVDSSAQNATVDLKEVSASGSYTVNVLSGTGYSTSTQLLSGDQTNSSSWGTKAFGVGAFIGQSIKVQVAPGYGTELQLDQAGAMENVVPAWSPAGGGAMSLTSDPAGFPFLGSVDAVQSGSFLADGTGYDNTTRGNWYKITYRMKSNFNPEGTDLGSYINVDVPGDVSPWFITSGSSTNSPPEDPVNVWLEKYFFVYNPASPNTVAPRSVTFKIIGWHGPDVASIEKVDGPGQTKVLGSPFLRSAGAAPAGLLQSTDTSAGTSDPVDVVSGDYFQAHTDLAIPGRGVPLSFTRSYAAQAPASGPIGTASVLGAKWSYNWQANISSITGSVVRIKLPGGASEEWGLVGSAWVGPPGIEGSLVHNGDGSWTLTTGSQLVYTFNSAGVWTAVADRDGNTTSLTYNGSGQLTTITDPGGRSLTLTYGTSGTGNGRIISVADGSGRSVSYTYDVNGDLVTITDVMGGTISYAYSGHLLTQGTDAKGHVFVRNTYDASGRVTTQLDVNGGTTTIAYDTPGAGATRVTDQRGKQTTYYFDQQMRITDVVDNDGNVTSTAWDQNNNKTSVTDALGKVWSYTYDSHHNVLTATDPLSKVWTYAYDAKNDVLTVTDPLSRLTTYAYDSNGNLTSVTDANSKVTSFTVNSQGLVTGVTDPLGHTTSLGYDTYGNRTTVTNALAKVWTSAYDSAGRVTSVTDPLGHSTSYTYDNANDVLTVTDPLSHVTTSTYDANGHVLTVTAADGKVTTYAYNAKDELSSVTDPAGGVTAYTYDAVGNIATKSDPRAKVTTYGYDNQSRLHTETDPLGQVRTYGYDAAGRLTSRQDAKSQTTTYTYDGRDALTNVTYPDLSSVSFAYNDAGARTQMVDSTGTTAYSYDSLSRLTAVIYPGARTVSYGYDAAGRRTSITYPGGLNQVAYTYDAANRLSTVTDWNSQQTAYAYDDANRMTTATLPNGVVGTSNYDNANRLTGISYVKGGTPLASANYTLDAVGNRTARTDLGGTQTYAYDNAYRLTSVTYPGPSTTTYAYDAFGNRTSMTGSAGTTTTAYNDASEITSVTPPRPAPGVSYAYDANGNVTARGSDTFAWDYENRLTAATVGGTNSTYTYRGDGLRNSATTGGATTTFTWDINRSLPVVLDDGSQYVYGNGLVSQVSGANTSYYLSDGLGSMMATTDASGNVVNAYTYDVYGKTTASSGSQPNSFQFAGQQTDPTGLQYLRARYYDPSTGSFLSRDPLSALPSWSGSPFGYARANPATFSDPRGKCIDENDFTQCWYLGGEAGVGAGDQPFDIHVGDQAPPTIEPDAAVTNEAGSASTEASGSPKLVGEYPEWNADPNKVGHIFDAKTGHVNPQTPEERAPWIKTFQEVASDPANLVSKTSYNAGTVEKFRYTEPDGSQVWVNVWTSASADRGIISDAGVNAPGMAR